MNSAKLLHGLAILLAVAVPSQARDSTFWDRLPAGPFTPGFRLVETTDASRCFPANDGRGVEKRPIRIYLWYPGRQSTDERLRFGDYVRMAQEDFRPPALPVPLAKGVEAGSLKTLIDLPAGAVRGAAVGPKRYPILILGQGLFYESPLSHFVLCEFMASHGYLVATSPLLGTRYRLVNLTVEDLETEVRDMEFVLATARALPFADPARIGVIGYDLGGMAGLILAMRNPEVGCFLSLDSGILDRHDSGLPNSHPQYHEERFRIPWMHMTQSRFIRSEKERDASPSLFERKAFGASYLVHVPTSNHGDFSSYAALSITRAVPGYWGPSATDPEPLYEEICRTSLAFFDRYLKQEGHNLEKLLDAGKAPGTRGPGLKIEWKKDRPAPPPEAELVHLIIEKGAGETGRLIDRIRADHSRLQLIDESVLNWLGLHFLYWWGREDEAVLVFELNASLHPGSWKAQDILGVAYAERGRREEAIGSYRKSLELNPENSHARAAIERLTQPPKKVPDGANAP